MPEIKEIEQICSIEELNVTPNTDTTCVTEMKPMKHGKNVSSSSDSIKRANLMKAFLHVIIAIVVVFNIAVVKGLGLNYFYL